MILSKCFYVALVCGGHNMADYSCFSHIDSFKQLSAFDSYRCFLHLLGISDQAIYFLQYRFLIPKSGDYNKKKIILCKFDYACF